MKLKVTKTQKEPTQLIAPVEDAQVNARRIATVELPETPSKIESESLPIQKIVGQKGEVNVSFGLTIGLPRKFEFARVDVGCRVPCGEGQMDAAYEKAREWAMEKIKIEVAAIREMEKEKAGADTDVVKDPVL